MKKFLLVTLVVAILGIVGSQAVLAREIQHFTLEVGPLGNSVTSSPLLAKTVSNRDGIISANVGGNRTLDARIEQAAQTNNGSWRQFSTNNSARLPNSIPITAYTRLRVRNNLLATVRVGAYGWWSPEYR